MKTALTVAEVVSEILRQIPATIRPDTVDTLKVGSEAQIVNGIVTTFLATCDVIDSAIENNQNLILTHEPTFYNHLDEVEWLTNDPVYEHKRRLATENGIAIWRLHDYWHQRLPDPMRSGIRQTMDWEDDASEDGGRICTIPAIPLGALAIHLRGKLSLDCVRVVGDKQQICSRVGLLPGASGGRGHIEFLGKNDIDVLVVGEIAEWETCEYVRDAVHAGLGKGLIILGHANSEEAGMKLLAEWLTPLFPGLPVSHVPAHDPFHFV